MKHFNLLCTECNLCAMYYNICFVFADCWISSGAGKADGGMWRVRCVPYRWWCTATNWRSSYGEAACRLREVEERPSRNDGRLRWRFVASYIHFKVYFLNLENYKTRPKFSVSQSKREKARDEKEQRREEERKQRARANEELDRRRRDGDRDRDKNRRRRMDDDKNRYDTNLYRWVKTKRDELKTKTDLTGEISFVDRNFAHRSRSRSRDRHYRDDDNHRRHSRDKGER